MWEFCGKAQLPQSFRLFARNSAETQPFHKVSAPNFLNIFQYVFWLVPEEEEEDDEDEPEDEEEAGSFSFSDVETDESKKEEESLSYHSPYEIPSGKKRFFLLFLIHYTNWILNLNQQYLYFPIVFCSEYKTYENMMCLYFSTLETHQRL